MITSTAIYKSSKGTMVLLFSVSTESGSIAWDFQMFLLFFYFTYPKNFYWYETRQHFSSSDSLQKFTQVLFYTVSLLSR